MLAQDARVLAIVESNIRRSIGNVGDTNRFDKTCTRACCLCMVLFERLSNKLDSPEY